jgi:hypothetical protein
MLLPILRQARFPADEKRVACEEVDLSVVGITPDRRFWEERRQTLYLPGGCTLGNEDF